MGTTERGIGAGKGANEGTPALWPLSGGEIHYLWWYIQGSIMEPSVRWRLRRAWGMCERHAWGALAVEAAFRDAYFHGPAILYHDLIERALAAFNLARPWQPRRLARRLRATGPCLMCEMRLDHASRDQAKPELIEEGQNLRMLRAFAGRTRKHWQATVCGECVGGSAAARCRVHLLGDLRSGRIGDIDAHRRFLAYIFCHLTAYRRSFLWGYHDTETDEDRAALVSAVGWCSGWKAGHALIAQPS